MEPLTPGTLLASRYRIEELLGQGSTTVVYRASHVAASRPVAVKFLIPEAGYPHYENATARFLAEARALAKVRHEGIVELYDHGATDDGTIYMVMEYVSGGTLQDQIEKRRFQPREVLALGARLATALGAVHDRGMVHGDVKPANIFLPNGELERAKLGDFGLVERVMPRTGVTATGFVLGTPYYMSPEQAAGRGRSAKSDIWGLGVVLYECAYGRLPFEGDSIPALLVKILSEAPRFDRLPGGLHDVLAWALQKDPANRYGSMREFHAELERVADPLASGSVVLGVGVPRGGGEPQAARTLESARASAHERRSRPLGLLGLGFAALGIAAAIALLFPQSFRFSNDALRIAAATVIAVICGLLSAGLAYVLLNRATTRGERRRARLRDDAGRLRRKANTQDVLSRSVAIAVEKLLADSASDPTVDLRKVSLVLAIQGFHEASGRSEQQRALDRALAIADKLRDQLSQEKRPWYARHKEALTLGTAVISAATALASSLFGFFK